MCYNDLVKGLGAWGVAFIAAQTLFFGLSGALSAADSPFGACLGRREDRGLPLPGLSGTNG